MKNDVPLLPLDFSGGNPPEFTGSVPAHVAIVMDGNGRWANERGLTRTDGHKRGEEALFDVIAGAVQAGVQHLSVYAFSTENWRRSPEEVRFLMGFNRQILRQRRKQLHAWNVRMRWAGRKPKLWRSVLTELQAAEELTVENTGMTLTMCINYGGRLELTDAVRRIAEQVAEGKISPRHINERTIGRALYVPELPDVDLFLRTSGEKRTSNFLLWQSAYAEMMFVDKLWPDFTRADLWQAIADYGKRDRRFGGAVDTPVVSS